MTFEELQEQWTRTAEPGQRTRIMRELAGLRDPRAADLFRQAIRSDDEDVRAIAASGLTNLGVDDALDALIATINDAPDPLHHDVTPAVVALTRLGLRGLPPILDLLDSTDPLTRQRAQKVLERVTFADVSGAAKPGQASEAAGSRWAALWAANESYDWNAPAPRRQAAIARWRRWVSDRLAP
jgi:HEAT repeat protein